MIIYKTTNLVNGKIYIGLSKIEAGHHPETNYLTFAVYSAVGGLV